LPPLVVKTTYIIDSTDDGDENSADSDASDEAMEELMYYLVGRGYAMQDIWNGSVDLRQIWAEYGTQMKTGKREVFVVEFFFPPIPEFNGVFSKAYQVPKKATVRDVLNLVLTKSKIVTPQRFELATISTSRMEPTCPLYEYGLGSLFSNWQLKIIDRENPEVTGTMTVDFIFPIYHEIFKGKPQKQSVVIDVFEPASELLQNLALSLGVVKPHLFELSHDGEVIDPEDNLYIRFWRHLQHEQSHFCATQEIPSFHRKPLGRFSFGIIHCKPTRCWGNDHRAREKN